MNKTFSKLLLLVAAFTIPSYGCAKGDETVVFDKEAVVCSADVIREIYEKTPTVYLYQGNGRFGSSYGRLVYICVLRKRNQDMARLIICISNTWGEASFTRII